MEKVWHVWLPPKDMLRYSAGCRVMWRLYGELSKRGLKVEPIFQVEAKKYDDTAKEYDVAVYPEIIPKRQSFGKLIVRYYLNAPGLLGGDGEIFEDEIRLYYNDCHKQYGQFKLFIPVIDTEIFHPPKENSARTIEAVVYRGKYRGEILPEHRNYFEIPRRGLEHMELGNLLRQTKILICYDNLTALSFEAVLCGCQVVFPNGHIGDPLPDNPERAIVALQRQEEDMQKQLDSVVDYVEKFDEEKH